MKIEIWLIHLQLRRFFTTSKTFIWANVVCRKMKFPTKRIFYHFGVYSLYLDTILVAFWHRGYYWVLFCYPFRAKFCLRARLGAQKTPQKSSVKEISRNLTVIKRFIT